MRQPYLPLPRFVVTVRSLQRHPCVHATRDLKPENIMVTAVGECKLVDFGTAKDEADTALNGPEFVGTPDYLPPEVLMPWCWAAQTRRVVHGGVCALWCVRVPQIVKSTAKGTCATDLWALGVLVYQMVAGRTPFKVGGTRTGLWVGCTSHRRDVHARGGLQAASPYLTFKRIEVDADVEYPATFPGVARSFVRLLLHRDPVTRVAAARGAGAGSGGADGTWRRYNALWQHPFLSAPADSGDCADAAGTLPPPPLPSPSPAMPASGQAAMPEAPRVWTHAPPVPRLTELSMRAAARAIACIPPVPEAPVAAPPVAAASTPPAPPTSTPPAHLPASPPPPLLPSLPPPPPPAAPAAADDLDASPPPLEPVATEDVPTPAAAPAWFSETLRAVFHSRIMAMPSAVRAELRRQVALRRSLGSSHTLGLFVPCPEDARFLRAEGRTFIGLEQDVQVCRVRGRRRGGLAPDPRGLPVGAVCLCMCNRRGNGVNHSCLLCSHTRECPRVGLAWKRCRRWS